MSSTAVINGASISPRTGRLRLLRCWLGRRLQMGVPGSPTQYVQRLRLHSSASRDDRRRILSRIHT